MTETKELTKKQPFSREELAKMQRLTQAMAAAVHELHKNGLEWHGQGVMILLGVDAEGKAAVTVAADQDTPITQQAAAKAIQAYTDVIVPPDVPGCYL